MAGGVKIHAYQNIAKPPLLQNTSIWLETNGWVGSLLYSNSQAEYCDGCMKLNKQAPGSAQAKACKCYEVVQKAGASPGSFNLSLVGNAWWAIGGGAASTDYTQPNGAGPVFTGMDATKQVVMLGGIVDNWGGANPWAAGNVTVPDIKPTAAADQAWRISTGLNLFTMLGKVDLRLNYPPPSSAPSSKVDPIDNDNTHLLPSLKTLDSAALRAVVTAADAEPTAATATGLSPNQGIKISDMAFWNDQEEGYLSAARGWSLGAGGNFTLSARSNAALQRHGQFSPPTTTGSMVFVMKLDDTAGLVVSRTSFNCTYSAGLEYGGGDLLPQPVPAATPDACCKLCSEHNACAYWVFDTELKKEPPTQPTATHHCYLKNNQITVSKSSRFISGPPAPPSPSPGAWGWHNPCAGKQSSSPWCDEIKTNTERAQALIAAMTIDEKAAMMSARANPGIARLEIGTIHFQEALHGVITVCLSEQLCPTAFPAWIGMAASFDPQLWAAVATTIGTEGRAFANIKASHTDHALAFWAPNINMVRDPRWGRNQEVCRLSLALSQHRRIDPSCVH
jgi:hypothetical protein